MGVVALRGAAVVAVEARATVAVATVAVATAGEVARATVVAATATATAAEAAMATVVAAMATAARWVSVGWRVATEVRAGRMEGEGWVGHRPCRRTRCPCTLLPPSGRD